MNTFPSDEIRQPSTPLDRVLQTLIVVAVTALAVLLI